MHEALDSVRKALDYAAAIAPPPELPRAPAQVEQRGDHRRVGQGQGDEEQGHAQTDAERTVEGDEAQQSWGDPDRCCWVSGRWRPRARHQKRDPQSDGGDGDGIKFDVGEGIMGEAGGACDEVTVTGEPEPPNVMLILDRSCSMAGQRWTDLTTVVTSLVTNYDAEVNFGAQFYPQVVGADTCSVAIDVPVAPMNGNTITNLIKIHQDQNCYSTSIPPPPYCQPVV